ncbi:hypothetical protein [Rhodococcus sp. WAY2]|uniref:hypothetical protein n=1 Tax=Rhodococcus sp. WAY2 TaxID=2663121 RepID=UPI001358A50B|nr:hypothetical protein [Rhodococcus sp. WAY2]
MTPVASADHHNNQYLCGHWVQGLIKNRYDQVPGILQCPTTDELTNPGNSGKRQHFGTRGNIYWRNYEQEAYSIWGMIWEFWAGAGYEQGKYQYPDSNEGCCTDFGIPGAAFRYQWFDSGCWALLWDPTQGYRNPFYCH